MILLDKMDPLVRPVIKGHDIDDNIYYFVIMMCFYFYFEAISRIAPANK